MNNVFLDKKCLTAVSRAYDVHHKIFFTILDHKGEKITSQRRRGQALDSEIYFSPHQKVMM